MNLLITGGAGCIGSNFARMATTLIRLLGRKDIDVKYTDLRPDENNSKDRFSTHENRRVTTDPLVTSVDVPTLSVDEVQSLSIANHERAFDWMRQQSTRSLRAGV